MSANENVWKIEIKLSSHFSSIDLFVFLIAVANDLNDFDDLTLKTWKIAW